MKPPRPATRQQDNKFPQPEKYQVWKKWVAFGLVLGALVVALSLVRKSEGTIDQQRNLSFSILKIDRIEHALHRMEAANTGFLLTGNESYREPFNRQRDIVSTNYQELLRFSIGDVTQQERLKNFKGKLTDWFTIYNPLIVRRRAAADSATESALKSRWVLKGLRNEDEAKLANGRRLFEEMHSLLGEIRATQEYKANSWREPDGAWYQILPGDLFSEIFPGAK